jgi:endonuclease/exonuclease/phosphatase (EEP) superfamily protein YafD
VAKLQILKQYVYGTGPSMPFAGQIGIFSKVPIENPQKILATGRLSYEVDLRLADRSLRLFCLHAPRPMGLATHDYIGYWDQVMPRILDVPDPAVVVGDFNATQYSRVYQTLTSGQLRSAHNDRGRGYATTWPNGRNWVPPIRIDQALLSPGVECVRIVEGRGLGSDHRPLILDVRIRRLASEKPVAAAAN